MSHLYRLPKDILVKLVCEIAERTRQQTLDSVFKEKCEKWYTKFKTNLDAQKIVKSVIYQNIEISNILRSYGGHTYIDLNLDYEPFITIYKDSFEFYHPEGIEIREKDINVFLDKIKNIKELITK